MNMSVQIYYWAWSLWKAHSLCDKLNFCYYYKVRNRLLKLFVYSSKVSKKMINGFASFTIYLQLVSYHIK